MLKNDDNASNKALPVVLIIDDSPVQTNIFRRLVKDIAAEFLIVETWQAAVDAIDSRAIDILITDYNLDDGYTGVDLVKHVQTLGQRTRCFFMTTESPTAIREHLGEIKPAGFLVKPLNFKKFRLFIEKLLAQKPPSSH